MRAVRTMIPRTPVLWVAPEHDYPGLRRIAPRMYGALPANALMRMYNPDSDHLGAPAASIDEIVRRAKELAAH